MSEMFKVGEQVWFVQSGTTSRYVECPDCLGQCALTVRLGDGSEVSIECECCREGYLGSRGTVRVYEWRCDVESGIVKGMEVDGENVRYKLTNRYPEAVYATEGEAQVAAVAVLAEHQAEEERRFNHVKDNAGRHHTWAWNVSYHRREAKKAKHNYEYHESRVAVAKAKEPVGSATTPQLEG